MSTDHPPHPDAARPPSPARGEGLARRDEGAEKKSGLVSVGARSRNVGTGSRSGTAQPSPLAGEGGERRSRSPGEGDADKQKASVPPKTTANPNRPLRSKRKRDTARKLRRDMTEAERRLWSLLRNRKLTGCKFRRQVAIGPYIVDFLSFEARLIVEADGGQHVEAASDATRDAWLTERGYRILRFWNSDILDSPDGVLTTLATARSIQQEIAL